MSKVLKQGNNECSRAMGKSGCLLLKSHLQKATGVHHKKICPCGIKTSTQAAFFFCRCFLCVLQLQNGYVKPAQWRDVMTFSWMLDAKSKRPTICWVPAWRHLIPIPLMRHYRWNASRHHSPPKLALGLSDFSFHFSVFRNNTCITALCGTSAPSWYFHYLRDVWLNKGDLVSVTFSISL